MSTGSYSIYQLVDPRTGQPRYVGMTARLETRYQQHLKGDYSNPAKNAWVKELLDLGLVPTIEVLENLSTKAEAQEQEVIWIRTLLSQGAKLFNVSAAELNDQKITLYLSWSLLEKLEDMAIEYQRHTRKRIDPNKLMRRLIERATLDDFLDAE